MSGRDLCRGASRMGRSTPRARAGGGRRKARELGPRSPSRLVPRRATDGDGDEAESKKCDEDFSLGTPKKRSLETGGALSVRVGGKRGAAETEMEPETEDDEGEERTHVDIVSSPKFRRIHARVDRKMMRVVQARELALSALSEASVEPLSREMNERRGVNTPDMVNEGNNGVSSERSRHRGRPHRTRRYRSV